MLTQELPVKLTMEETLDKGKRLSVLHGEINTLREQRKASNSEFKSKIDEKTLMSEEMARVIREGYEIRQVEVVEEKDFDDRKIRTIRTDTGEIVGVRSMGLDDAQEVMFDEDRFKGKIAYLGERASE